MSEENRDTGKVLQDAAAKQAELQTLLDTLKLQPGRRDSVEEKKEHKFWNTQPVPQSEGENGEGVKQGPIDGVKDPKKDIRQTPLNLPKGFIWCDLDLNFDKYQEDKKNNTGVKSHVDEVYNLLTENYVEDDDNMFRFDYSPEFLAWALSPPNALKSWHVGLRNEKTGKLLAFVSGIPADIDVYSEKRKMAEVNFLCVHKKLREKRLTPVLIKEITRRVNVEDIWQAVYTAGVVLPSPISQARYYHRSLNPRKLIEVGFSALAPGMTMTQTIKKYKLPKEVSTPGFREMEAKDVPQVAKLLKDYLSKFTLRPSLSEEEVAHWILPREGVVNAYVVENDGKVTDFCSYYHLPSTIIGNRVHNTLRAVYSYYNVATSMSLKDLMHDALITAKQTKIDVFNALTIMDNEEFLHDLLFGRGDGELQYYLYNWAAPKMDPKGVGLVLV